MERDGVMEKKVIVSGKTAQKWKFYHLLTSSYLSISIYIHWLGGSETIWVQDMSDIGISVQVVSTLGRLVDVRKLYIFKSKWNGNIQRDKEIQVMLLNETNQK